MIYDEEKTKAMPRCTPDHVPIVLKTKDDLRKHAFNKSVKDYNNALPFYFECGYQFIELPKKDPTPRLQIRSESVLIYSGLYLNHILITRMFNALNQQYQARHRLCYFNYL